MAKPRNCPECQERVIDALGDESCPLCGGLELPIAMCIEYRLRDLAAEGPETYGDFAVFAQGFRAAYGLPPTTSDEQYSPLGPRSGWRVVGS